MKTSGVMLIGLSVLIVSLLFVNSKPIIVGQSTEAGDLSIIHRFANLSFDRPVDLQAPRDGSNRLFVVEQAGRIHAFENVDNVSESTTFLDISDKVIAPPEGGNEEGLLGLAFHPDFSTNGYFFVYYSTNTPRRTVLSRFTVDAQYPDMADLSSERIIIEIEQPYANHNGGQVSFGLDGYLYIALGDGGSGGDPLGNGQNRSTLLGALLRIDVDKTQEGLNYSIPSDNPFIDLSDSVRKEIYAYGLRNPWRFSFDNQTGNLWVGDVGQNAIEEIDLIEAGGNYGWNTKEGTSCYNPAIGCDSTGLIDPITEYTHNLGRSVTGGFVYRGTGIPSLYGKYIYGDFISGRIWSLEYNDGEVLENVELFDTDLLISSFGVDTENNLYILSFDGAIYSIHEEFESSITATPPSTTSTTIGTNTTQTDTTTPPVDYGEISLPVLFAIVSIVGLVFIVIAITRKR
ncbi:MAG: PQQ-dependent sugar dehydrogenase [Candidatus Thorarchaeota archaeon]